jgi:hypothetical protein
MSVSNFPFKNQMAERNTLELETGDGKSYTMDYANVDGISQSFTFYNLENPNDVDGWRSFLKTSLLPSLKDF